MAASQVVRAAGFNWLNQIQTLQALFQDVAAVYITRYVVKILLKQTVEMIRIIESRPAGKILNYSFFPLLIYLTCGKPLKSASWDQIVASWIMPVARIILSASGILY